MRLPKTPAISKRWRRVTARSLPGRRLGGSASWAGLVAAGGLWVGCAATDMPTAVQPATLPACSAAIAASDGVIIDPADSSGLLGSRLCIARNPDDKGPPIGALLPASEGSLQLGGYKAQGPVVRLQLTQRLGRRGLDLTLPLSSFPALLDKPSGRARLVVLSRFGHGAVHITAVENITVVGSSAAGSGQLRFHLPGHEVAPLSPDGVLGDVGLFQVAAPEQLGQSVKRKFSYRAIGGVSMGGIGASMNFFRHPDLYDAVGVMGADPGPDLTYSQGFIQNFFFGGFCPPDGSNPGCPQPRAPLVGQGEVSGSFDAMPVQRGEGIGLTLRRSLYLRANRDLVRALGNWAYYNPRDPYLPPGVAATTLSQTPAQACQNPVVLKGKQSDPAGKPFYDGRYNREGKFDVITFCDGGEVADQPGVYDDKRPQTDPAQILLAVDLNGNGRRDKGEPVLLQQGEPFRDVGTDGKASQDEPGYDPVLNPDPAGDDYHYLKNPGGSEGNWRYDVGEPYSDVGLDGVTGGCEIDSGQAGCFDHGEANGRFDLNPGLKRWLEHDPHTLAEQLPSELLNQRDIYYDAGIRDFFNAQVSTNSLFGVLAQRGLPLRLFGGFPALAGKGPGDEATYDAAGLRPDELGSAVYVRYGNPEATAASAEKTGDGRHAGSVTEVVQRAVTLFSYLLSRWPDGDRSLQSSDDRRLIPPAQSFTLSSGRQVPYGIVLPPGYFDPQNQSVRYPIAYFGHGYGMAPEDLGTGIGSLIQGFMSDSDPSHRLPKAILVFVDAKCRPGGEVPNGPLPADGDLCEEGTFYTDHAAGAYKGELMMSELDSHLRAKYRLREPAEVELPY